MGYKQKMYEIHSVINDILYEAEKGKISWEEACRQAKAEADFEDEDDADEDDEDETEDKTPECLECGADVSFDVISCSTCGEKL